MSKTYLVKIPPNNHQKASAFEEVLVQLHETLRGEKVAFEIVATGQNVGFCFSAEPAVCEIVAGQIYAVAPDADIVEIPDYIKSVQAETKFASIELGLQKGDLLPLKTHSEFDGDSLSGILSVLSKCFPGEQIVIQIVVRPKEDSGMHNLKLDLRKKADRFRHMFRVKYWFKRDVGRTFSSKIDDKNSGRLYEVNLRVAAIGHKPSLDVEHRLKAVLGALSNFNTLDYNQLIVRRYSQNQSSLPLFLERSNPQPFLLSTSELAGIYHLPNEKEVPNLIHVLSKKEAPPMDIPTDRSDPTISFFGQSNFRDQKVPFGIRTADRRRHLYTLGKSGSGKSKLLELLISNDIYAGRGVGVLDPHGDLVDNVLRYIPKHRIKDVVIFDPSDLQHPASFNPLEQVSEELKMRVTIGFIEIFKKLFGNNWSPRLEHVLRYTTLALLDSPNTTVLSIMKMLTDKNYRQRIVRNIQDNVVKNFWVNEFAGWSEKFDNEAITPLLNKIGQFVATNMIRNIVGQPGNKMDFRKFMDEKKIVLMKVSKGILGEENSALLGAIAVTKIYQAAMSRADILEDKRVDFYFYVDEFQNFATDSFDEILSEARKYRLNLTLANQFLGQLSDSMRKTVFGNVGSLLSFRVGGEDAKLLAAEYNPRFSDRDLINLGVQEFSVKMSINGEIKEAFSGKTLPVKYPAEDYSKECIEFSRRMYARPLKEVLDILKAWEEGKEEAPIEDDEEFEEPLI